MEVTFLPQDKYVAETISGYMVTGAVVSGRVIDPNSVGLDNATMIVGEKITLCSQDGSFSVHGVPVGRQKYKIVHRDYPVVRGKIDIPGDSAFLFMMIAPRDRSSTEPGKSILEIKRQIEPWLLEEHATVVGVGISSTQDEILVYVRAAEGEIPILPDVPERIGGFFVRVVPINSPVQPPNAPGVVSRERRRPICGGISAARYDIPAGTLGAIVYSQDTGEPLLLSNNHTFAGCSSEEVPRANIGDPIVQPSGLDGGNPDDVVGELTGWVPYRTIGNNFVDVAVARPRPGVAIDDRVLVGGEPVSIRGVRPATDAKSVRRCGRTTGCVTGEIVDWNFTTIMEYPTGENIRYVDQILIDMPTEQGDSGSLILDDENYAIGLLSGTTVVDGKVYTVANKIRNVLEAADVEISGEDATRNDPPFGAFCATMLLSAFVAMCLRG